MTPREELKEIMSINTRQWLKKRHEERLLKSVKVGRNDPCECGSGKKYKKCCGV